MKTIGVVGCGLMGRGIVEVSAASGYQVVVREINSDLLDGGLKAIRQSVDRAVAKGKRSEEEGEALTSRIVGTTDLAELAACDLVIEAIVEDLDAKTALYSELENHLSPAAILASNTSSLTVTQLAASTQRPDRFIGIHFFNPVPVMKLVEIVTTLMVDPNTVTRVSDYVESLGKRSIECKDNSGFIVNRLLVPYLLDAIRAYENGFGSLEDIDEGMKLGCGHPMGPFVLLDFIGLDTIYNIAEIMFDEYRETRFAPPPLLKQMVQAGHLGRKSGRGFYDYG